MKVSEKFRNNIPIYSWFKPYRCDFTHFITGTFSTGIKDGIGVNTYTTGDKKYPEELWKTILKYIKG